MSEQLCSRCGGENDAIEITTYGDPKPVFLYGECPCPSPHCPFCARPLDYAGRCTCGDCFMWHLIVPIPEMIGKR